MSWIRFSIKKGEALICDKCEKLIKGLLDPDLRPNDECIYVQVSNKSIICRECFEKKDKGKPKDIWDLW